MTTKTLFSTRMTAKPPIFGAGRSKLDHSFITKKYLDIPGNPLYVPQPEDLMRGLVGWWGDDGKSAATWRDQTPGGVNHGTVYGAGTPPPATPGALGYTFDGEDDYVDMGNDISLRPANTLTVSFWMKVLSEKADQFPIAYGSTAGVGWLIDVTGTNAICKINADTQATVNIPLSPTTNTWYYITFTYNNGTFVAYRNGIYINSVTTTGNINYTGLTAMYIGNSQSLNSVRFFNGSIDEVRIFNRALSPGEITALFNLNRGKFGV